jgi:anti-sigma factor ChrR (cupin superfamily)
MERQSAIHAALEKLRLVQRRLISLAFFQGLTHQEIAVHTGLPLGTVKTHLRQDSPMQFLTVRADEGDWVPFVPGVEMKMLFEDPARRKRSLLVRMHPGAIIPGHPHPEHEEYLVLDGEISIGNFTVRAGDYHLAPKGLSHPAITSRTGALLFVTVGCEPAVPGQCLLSV